MRRLVIALVAGSLVSVAGLARAQGWTPVATLELSESSVAAGIGFSWGSGTLSYQGRKYPVTAQGTGRRRGGHHSGYREGHGVRSQEAGGLFAQLVLGLDRDSGTVAHLFDERNAAVKRMLRQAIEAAKRVGKPIGICGQAPSDYPDLAEWLVECGIDSMSLNPDTAIKTAFAIARAEARRERAASPRIDPRPTIAG
jgi:hypothetical protein